MTTLRQPVTILRWLRLQNMFFFIAAALLPLFSVILWLTRNTQLPTADAANYFSTAIDVYHHFINGGIKEGLHSLYFDRGWRPIFFPVLLVPFLGLFHGNLYITSNLMILTTFFIGLFYVYLIIRLRLDALSAIIATNLVGLLPLFQTQFLTLFAESAFFPCVMACLYHLVKSDYMQNIKHSLCFAFFMSLALLIRPVEAVMHLFLVMIIFMYSGWQRRIFSLQSIGKIKNLLMPVFAMIACLVLFWFVPFTDEMHSWIYRTSIGDVALGAGPDKYPFWQTAYNYLFAEGSVVVTGVASVALISLFSLERVKLYGVLSSAIFIYLISMVPFAFWEVFYSVQATPRRLSIAFPALLMSLLLIGLQRGRYWSVRFCGILILLIMQFIFIIILNLTETQLSWLNTVTGYLIPQPVTIYPNPHDKILQFFANEVKQYHLADIVLEVNPDFGLPYDPFLLSTMVEASNQGYATSYSYFSHFLISNPETISKSHSGLFLSDRADKMNYSFYNTELYNKLYQSEKDPSLKTYYQFLLYFSQRKLADINWRIASCITLTGKDHNDYRGCLLLPRNKGQR